MRCTYNLGDSSVVYVAGASHTIQENHSFPGRYMVWSATTFKYVFDYKPGDVFWCTADCGWITGHSYITYGPTINGATQVP